MVGEYHLVGSEPHGGWNRWKIGGEGVQARDTTCMKVSAQEEAWDSLKQTGSRCGWGTDSKGGRATS